jgi:drug/metabolite transporter (DMT)-like permease
MPFYVFAWIAAVVSGVATVIGKLTAKHSLKNVWLFNFFWSGFTLLFIAPVAIANGVSWPTSWLNIIWTSVLGSIFYITYAFCIYKFDVSTFTPLFNLRIGLAVVLGVIFLGEQLTIYQIGLIGIMMITGILVTLDEKFNPRSFFQWPILIVFTSMISLTIQSVFIKKAMMDNGYWEVTLWSSVLTQLILLLTLPWFYKDIRQINRQQLGSLGLMGLCDVVVILASLKAFATNVSISSAIISIPFSMLIAFGLSFIAPKLLEKHALKVYAMRFAATGIMIWAALRLSA